MVGHGPYALGINFAVKSACDNLDIIGRGSKCDNYALCILRYGNLLVGSVGNHDNLLARRYNFLDSFLVAELSAGVIVGDYDGIVVGYLTRDIFLILIVPGVVGFKVVYVFAVLKAVLKKNARMPSVIVEIANLLLDNEYSFLGVDREIILGVAADKNRASCNLF